MATTMASTTIAALEQGGWLEQAQAYLREDS